VGVGWRLGGPAGGDVTKEKGHEHCALGIGGEEIGARPLSDGGIFIGEAWQERAGGFLGEHAPRYHVGLGGTTYSCLNPDVHGSFVLTHLTQ